MVEAQRLIRASREHVFAFVAHPEHLPRYGAPLWLAADADERHAGGPLVTLRGYFAGLPAEAVIRSVSRPPASIEIVQVRGTLRGFSQQFTIESAEDGTVVRCRVEADAGITMITDDAAKHFLVQYVERMLDRLKLAAERRAPSRRPVRPTPKSAAADAAVDADDIAADDAAPERTSPNIDQQDAGAPAHDVALPGGAAATQAQPRPVPPLPRRGPPHRAGAGEVRGTSAGSAGGERRDEPRLGHPSAPSAAVSGEAGAAQPGHGRRRRRHRRRRGRGTPAGGGDAQAST